MNSSENASNGHIQALMPPTPFVIRFASPKDARQMLDIYGPVVLNTAISFEVETPTEEAFRRRIAATLQRLPWLVCLCQNRVAGYAYAALFRNRAGYRWSVEVSVYVSEEFRGRGGGGWRRPSTLRC